MADKKEEFATFIKSQVNAAMDEREAAKAAADKDPAKRTAEKGKAEKGPLEEIMDFFGFGSDEAKK